MKSFHLGSITGPLTILAAGSVVFAWRLPAGVARRQYIERVRLRGLITAAPGTAQGVAFGLYTATGFTANPTGGNDLFTNISPTCRDVQRIRVSDQIPTSVVATGNVRNSSGAALSITPATLNTQPFLRAQAFVSTTLGADGSGLLAEWSPATSRAAHNDPLQGCLPLLEDTGFAVAVDILMGPTMTAALGVEVDWLEE